MHALLLPTVAPSLGVPSGTPRLPSLEGMPVSGMWCSNSGAVPLCGFVCGPPWVLAHESHTLSLILVAHGLTGRVATVLELARTRPLLFVIE